MYSIAKLKYLDEVRSCEDVWVQRKLLDGEDPTAYDFFLLSMFLECRKRTKTHITATSIIMVEKYLAENKDYNAFLLRDRPARVIAEQLLTLEKNLRKGPYRKERIRVGEACAMYAGYLGMAKVCRGTYHAGNNKYKNYTMRMRMRGYRGILKWLKKNPWVGVGVLALLVYTPKQDWHTSWIPENSPFRLIMKGIQSKQRD